MTNTDMIERVPPDSPIFTITSAVDKPDSGMWHCGPNNSWVQVTHNPTGISATAYHKSQHKARQTAMAAVELMIQDSPLAEAHFPEKSPVIKAASGATNAD